MATLEREYTADSREEADDSNMQGRMRDVRRFWTQYKGVFEQTNFGNNQALKKTEDWVQKTKLVDDRSEQDSIIHREEFFRSEYAQTLLRDAVPIYKEFLSRLEESSPYISKTSKERWMKRFYDESIGFQAKKYWIKHQLPSYMAAWKNVAEERSALTKDPGFKDLVSLQPKFSILTDNKKEAFFDMHFDKRKDLIRDARSVLLAMRTLRLDLHAKAETKLRAAVGQKVLSPTKVGSWLERIFKAKQPAPAIKKFVLGNGPKSLEGLIKNWTLAKNRFDAVTKKAKERGEETAARGLHILSEGQFLGLHYDQRLKYVEELEKRLESSENIKNEKGIFVEIRHAMDVQDWEEATMLIAEAKLDPTLSGEEHTRLASMERYAGKFSKKTSSDESMNQVLLAKQRIDTIMHELERSHSSVHPMIMRLMKGPMANRSIKQLGWTVYNNKWCRGHGFLDDNIAKRGASQQNEKLTKERAHQGKDIGRHDVMSYETAGQNYIRKKEFSSHKATYRHVNVKDGVTLSQNAEWFEREQDPKELYWTTACFHEDGEPKSENWHNELLLMLYELRGHTRTLGNAEMMYQGYGQPLRKRGIQRAPTYSAKSAPSNSVATTLSV